LDIVLAGAVCVKAKESAGAIRLTAKHPYPGTSHVNLVVKPAAPELA